MYLPNSVAFSSFKDSISGVASLVITDVPEDTSELIKLLNVIKVMDTSLDLGKLTIVSKGIKVLCGDGKGSMKISAAELKDKLTITKININSAQKTSRNTRSGLIYSPMFNGPLFFDKAKNTLISPTTEVIKGALKDLLLQNCESLYVKHLKDYMPAVHVLEVQKAKTLVEARELQKARGFTSAISVGDSVRIMSYEDQVAMYGENTTAASVPFIKSQFPTYGVPFIKPLSHLAGIDYVINTIDSTTGEVTLNTPDGARVDVSELEINGEMHQLSPTPIFHEQMLVKN